MLRISLPSRIIGNRVQFCHGVMQVRAGRYVHDLQLVWGTPVSVLESQRPPDPSLPLSPDANGTLAQPPAAGQDGRPPTPEGPAPTSDTPGAVQLGTNKTEYELRAAIIAVSVSVAVIVLIAGAIAMWMYRRGQCQRPVLIAGAREDAGDGGAEEEPKDVPEPACGEGADSGSASTSSSNGGDAGTGGGPGSRLADGAAVAVVAAGCLAGGEWVPDGIQRSCLRVVHVPLVLLLRALRSIVAW